MNRRAFAIMASTVLSLTGTAIHAQQQGVKIRFVIARITKRPDGAESRSTYENAVLMAPNERYQAEFQDEYSLTVRPISTGAGFTVEVSLIDTKLNPANQMSGQIQLEVGQGGSIAFQSSGNEKYALGLLVTSHPLPKGAA
jgi:hypothetical protein